jgi:hypothetical protein
VLSKINYKPMIPLWVIGIIYILPILLTNSSYYDDIGRSVYGYFSWGIDGRPLSDFIFKTLDLGAPATDISPFPQIISMLIMTSLCYLMHRYLNPDHRYGWLVFTPIFLSPFFIQNFAFRFDSLSMSLSVAISAIPLFFMKSGKIKLFAYSAICVFSSLCLYQASLSVFVAVVCFHVIFSIKKEEDSYKTILESIVATAGMAVGYLFYLKIIIPIFVTSDYANGYNQIIGNVDELKGNILITVNILRSFFAGFIAKVFLFVFLLSLFGLMVLIIKVYKSEGNLANKAVKLMLIILSIGVMMLCIPGPGLALKGMPTGPRVFIGFGFAISLMFALISFISKRHQSKLNSIYCIIIVISFSYMATFSNAMKSQDRLTDRIINGITNDINKVGNKEVKTITIDGNSPYSAAADKAIQKFPLLKQIIPSYFDGPLAWGIVKMTEIYSGKDQPSPPRQNEIISTICNMQLVTDAGLYKTYFNKGDLVVSFTDRDCK